MWTGIRIIRRMGFLFGALRIESAQTNTKQNGQRIAQSLNRYIVFFGSVASPFFAFECEGQQVFLLDLCLQEVLQFAGSHGGLVVFVPVDVTVSELFVTVCSVVIVLLSSFFISVCAETLKEKRNPKRKIPVIIINVFFILSMC